MTRIARVGRAQYAVINELTCDGASNEQIAERLGCDVETVKSHIKTALAATGCHTRTELAVAILRGRILLNVDRHSRPPRHQLAA